MPGEILVVREFDKFSQILCSNDFLTINLPLIKTQPLENLDALEIVLPVIDKYDGLFFTSPHAAQIFLKRIDKLSLTYSGRIYVLGKRTKTLFENTVFEIKFYENANTAEDLLKLLDKKDLAGKKFLFVRGDKSLRTIPKLLKNIAEVDELIVYRTIETVIKEEFAGEIKAKFEHRMIECVCFFSPSGIENFIRIFDKDLLSQTKTAVIGRTTGKKLQEAGLKADFVASKADAESFAIELVEYLRVGKSIREN